MLPHRREIARIAAVFSSLSVPPLPPSVSFRRPVSASRLSVHKNAPTSPHRRKRYGACLPLALDFRAFNSSHTNRKRPLVRPLGAPPQRNPRPSVPVFFLLFEGNQSKPLSLPTRVLYLHSLLTETKRPSRDDVHDPLPRGAAVPFGLHASHCRCPNPDLLRLPNLS